MKRYLAVPFAVAAAMAAVFFSLAPATAQTLQLRTWVSAEGSDINQGCSFAQPCQSFAGAQNQTAAHGEIVCKDSGDFQPVTIQKSITINCRGVAGAIGNGSNSTAAGIVISFDSFAPSDSPQQVILKDLTIQGSNNGTEGTGISIGSFNGSRRAVVRNTVITNSTVGISVGANSEVVISHSDLSDNATAGLMVSASTGSVTVDSTTIEHNGFAFQNSGTVRLSNSDVSYNSTGWTGTISTFTNNRFTSNGPAGPLFPIGSLSNPTGEQ